MAHHAQRQAEAGGEARLILGVEQARGVVAVAVLGEAAGGGVTIRVTRAGALAGDYADVMLVALDAKPVAESKKLLLTQVALDHGEGWRFQDDADTTVIFGGGPNRAEPVGVTLTLPGDGWRMTPLHGNGRPAGGASEVLDTSGGKSLWFLIERD